MTKFWVSWLVFLCFASLADTVVARVLSDEVLSVRVEGYVGSQPNDAPVEVSWTVKLQGELYELHVTKLRVLTGNVAYYEIITALKPYRPTLTISGEDGELDRFATAPAGQKVAINGFLDVGGGARYLLVSAIEYIGEATPVAPSGAGGAPR